MVQNSRILTKRFLPENRGVLRERDFARRARAENREAEPRLTEWSLCGFDKALAVAFRDRLRRRQAMELNYLLSARGIDTTRKKVLVMRHTPQEPELRKALPWLAAEDQMFSTLISKRNSQRSRRC